MAALVFKK